MKNKKLGQLKHFYLFILLLTFILVGPPHIFSAPSFMPLRFPHYLEMMSSFLGISWPMTFQIYHWILLIIGLIGVINVLGIIFYPKFKLAAIASSLIGLFLTILMVLFFFFVFTKINFSTAIIYGLYSVVLLITNWLTFKALIIRQKEA